MSATGMTDTQAPAEAPASAPAREGYFGPFGGQFVPESLSGELSELTEAWRTASQDPDFMAELDHLRRTYGGRPTPLYRADRLSAEAGLEV